MRDNDANDVVADVVDAIDDVAVGDDHVNVDIASPNVVVCVVAPALPMFILMLLMSLLLLLLLLTMLQNPVIICNNPQSTYHFSVIGAERSNKESGDTASIDKTAGIWR